MSRPASLPMRRRAARQTAETVSRDVAVQASAHRRGAPRVCPNCGRVDDLFHRLTSGRHTVYGALLRFIDRAIAIGTPIEVLLRIPELLHWYIVDAHAPTGPRLQAA